VYKAFWWGNLGGKDHLEDPDIDRTILRKIFRKWDVGVWTGSGYRQVVGTCKCSNEPSGSINAGNFSTS